MSKETQSEETPEQEIHKAQEQPKESNLLEASGLSEEVVERNDFLGNDQPKPIAQQIQPKPQSTGIFGFGEAITEEEEHIYEAPTMTYSAFEEESKPEISTGITTSEFIMNQIENGVPEGIHLISKIKEKSIKALDFPEQGKDQLLTFAKKVNEDNRKTIVIPDWHLNNIRPGLRAFLEEKGLEQSLPSWLPLIFGVIGLLYWGISTTIEIKAHNEELLERAIRGFNVSLGREKSETELMRKELADMKALLDQKKEE